MTTGRALLEFQTRGQKTHGVGGVSRFHVSNFCSTIRSLGIGPFEGCIGHLQGHGCRKKTRQRHQYTLSRCPLRLYLDGSEAGSCVVPRSWIGAITGAPALDSTHELYTIDTILNFHSSCRQASLNVNQCERIEYLCLHWCMPQILFSITSIINDDLLFPFNINSDSLLQYLVSLSSPTYLAKLIQINTHETLLCQGQTYIHVVTLVYGMLLVTNDLMIGR